MLFQDWKRHQNHLLLKALFSFMRVVVYCGFISSGFDLSKLPVNGPQKPIQGFPVQCMLL